MPRASGTPYPCASRTATAIESTTPEGFVSRTPVPLASKFRKYIQLDEKERQTRKQRIDPKLNAASWSVVHFSGADLDQYKHAAVEEFPTSNGPADYALCDDATALGVVEAKKV